MNKPLYNSIRTLINYIFICLALVILLSSHAVQAEALSLSKKSVTLKPEQTHTLKIKNLPETCTVTWGSLDPSVAKISKKGKITAITDGQTTISCIVSVPYADKAGKTAYKDMILSCSVLVETPKTISVLAAGDVLVHQKVLDSGLQADGSYDYSDIFSKIKKHISPFDIKIINQETMFVDNSKKYSGYPSFGTPTGMGDSMRNAGFNVFTCATNHSWDKGITGIKDTVRYWKKHADTCLFTGIYTDEDDYNTIPVREFNGIRVAFLNYTEFINGSPKIDSYLVRMLNKKLCIKEIKAAKQEADLVIVLPHWGVEYEQKPNSSQIELAQAFADAGADLIIGNHPHVLQPLKILTSSDKRKVPCYYSLGNFVSNMYKKATLVEGLAELEIEVWNKKVTIKKADLVPIVNHISADGTKFKVYLLKDYTEKICKTHVLNNYPEKYSGVKVSYMNNLFDTLENEFILP